jgi:hypothetical protein
MSQKDLPLALVIIAAIVAAVTLIITGHGGWCLGLLLIWSLF